MSKPIRVAFGLFGLIALTACDVPLREASCGCFNEDGSKSGACDFAPIPTDPNVYTLSTKSEPC